MKVKISVDEKYPDYNIRIAKPDETHGVYEIEQGLYERFLKLMEEIHKMDVEISNIVNEKYKKGD